MFVGTPSGELRKVLKHIPRVGMKDVRAVFMNQNAVIVIVVVGVPTDVVAPVNNQDFFTCLACQSFGNNAARETCTYN